jgi:hypothetical protein
MEDTTIECATVARDKTVNVVLKNYSELNLAFFTNLRLLANSTKVKLFPTEHDLVNPTTSRELDSSSKKIERLTSSFLVYAEGLIDDSKQEKLDFKTAYKYLNYSPETGAISWKLDINPMVPKGSPGGFKHSSGQHIIKIDGEVYRLNRVIWLLQTGSWPKGRIKHKDSDLNNLKWSNLYEEKEQK